MLKKHISITLVLLFIAAHPSIAQVYTITAKYSALNIWAGGKNPDMVLDRVDTGHHYTFSIDLDKRTITNPIVVFPPDEVIPITEIIHDEANHTYILKYKRETGATWNYYKLRLSGDNKPIYIQKAEGIKGTSSKDTFFHTHTNYAVALSFYRKYESIKDTLLSEDQFTANRQISGLTHVRYRDTRDIVEMRDGYINWTRGKEETHHFFIASANLVNIPGSDGIEVRCYEKDGEFYDFAYLNSDRKVDDDDLQYRHRYLVITKYVNGKKLWFAILR